VTLLLDCKNFIFICIFCFHNIVSIAFSCFTLAYGDSDPMTATAATSCPCILDHRFSALLGCEITLNWKKTMLSSQCWVSI